MRGMRYEVKNRDIVSILIECGFTDKHRGSRGWVREWSNPFEREGSILLRANRRTSKKHGRLHAILTGNTIDMHFDKNENGTHRSSRFNTQVKAAIKEIRKADH